MSERITLRYVWKCVALSFLAGLLFGYLVAIRVEQRNCIAHGMGEEFCEKVSLTRTWVDPDSFN